MFVSYLCGFILLQEVLTLSSIPSIIIDYNETSTYKNLPKFWKNSGFCPPAPLNKASEFLLSNDVRQNIMFIGSMPYAGIQHLRIHWLMQLLRIEEDKARLKYVIEYTEMDEFMDFLKLNQIYPAIEFMVNESSVMRGQHTFRLDWQKVVYDFVLHYHERYGFPIIKKWKFETWNEPDLQNYNIMNYSLTDYLGYVKSVQNGIQQINQQLPQKLKLHGPAGLFKNITRHPFCWGIIEQCNDYMPNCPFDILTFHRKGTSGKAIEIVNGGLAFMQTLLSNYHNLKDIPISNNEADPISGWSKPHDFHADLRYASILVNTVFQHWVEMYSSSSLLHNLISISHDNAFLSYHPYEFTQRTLLARFQMNNTNPKHVQFIQKPVYSALAMLGYLAERADTIRHIERSNISYLSSMSYPETPFYSSIIVTLSNDTELLKPKNISLISIKILNIPNNDNEFKYIVESLETNVTDPFHIWSLYNRPAYPNATVRMEMRAVQTPRLILKPMRISKPKDVEFSLNLCPPWILLIRICSNLNARPTRVRKLVVERISENEVLIIWKNKINETRCIETYEINFRNNVEEEWQNITKEKHIPFLSYHHVGHIHGYYKVRAIDIFGRRGKFSKILQYGVLKK